MSTDRLERRLPEVLTELAIPRTPDYVDSLLSRTERMSQRPGWTFLERWFPVGTLTAPIPASRRLSLTPILTVLVVLALVAATLAIYFGTRSSRPPLFGPAANGLVLTTTSTGDIVAVDPSTSESRTLIAGPDLCCANVSPNGERFAFLRIPNGLDAATSLGFATMDGKVIRELPADVVRGIERFEWAPESDRAAMITAQGAAIVDVASGQITPIDVHFAVNSIAWMGATGDLMLVTESSNTVTNGVTFDVYRLASGATEPAFVTSISNAISPPLVSPDGSKFLYFIWGPEDRLHGDIHVYDFAAGTNVAVTEESVDDKLIWENPVWSPDGSRIAAELYEASGSFRIGIIPVTGGPHVTTGPVGPELANGAAIQFSPDGKFVLATYRFNGATYLLPVDGGEWSQVKWTVREENSWQRRAP